MLPAGASALLASGAGVAGLFPVFVVERGDAVGVFPVEVLVSAPFAAVPAAAPIAPAAKTLPVLRGGVEGIAPVATGVSDNFEDVDSFCTGGSLSQLSSLSIFGPRLAPFVLSTGATAGAWLVRAVTNVETPG
jgi:hypothetical protein